MVLVPRERRSSHSLPTPFRAVMVCPFPLPFPNHWRPAVTAPPGYQVTFAAHAPGGGCGNVDFSAASSISLSIAITERCSSDEKLLRMER